MGVKCDYCHAGIEQFTDKIEVAAKMFRLTEMMDVELQSLPCRKRRPYSKWNNCQDCYDTAGLDRNRQ